MRFLQAIRSRFRARKNQMESGKKRFRRLLLEQFEDRRLLATANPDEYSVAMNGVLNGAPMSNDDYEVSWGNENCTGSSGWVTDYDENGDPQGQHYECDGELYLTEDYVYGGIASWPSNGELAPSWSDHVFTFTYTPNTGFAGTDSFEYSIGDNGGNDTGTVTINVLQGADTNDDTYTTDVNTTLSIDAPGVLANDTGNGTLSVTSFENAAHGYVQVNADGSIYYSPSYYYIGPDSFTYTATDGTASDTATVTIMVDNPPIVTDDSAQMDGNVPVTGNVLTNDSDPNGTALTVTLVSDVSHGTLSLNSDGTFTYTPSNYQGYDTFVYAASDGWLSTPGTVTIFVNSIAPEACADSYSAVMNTVLTVDGPGVLANDTDANGNTLTAVRGTGPEHGVLSLNENGGFIYTPATGFHSADSFTYQASDGENDSNLATVSIWVNARPVAAGDSYETLYSHPLTINAPGLLANDSDADDDSLTVVSLGGVTGPAYLYEGYTYYTAHGAVRFNANGSFTYTPIEDFRGTDSFTYQVSDGLDVSDWATVSINLKSPVAFPDSYNTTRNTPLTVNASAGMLANDVTVDGLPLQVYFQAGGGAVPVLTAHGSFTYQYNGSFTYTPAPNFHGTDVFAYTILAQTMGPSVNHGSFVTIHVDAIPYTTDDDYITSQDTPLTIGTVHSGVLGNDTDDDGDSLTVAYVTGLATVNAGETVNTLHGSVTLARPSHLISWKN